MATPPSAPPTVFTMEVPNADVAEVVQEFNSSGDKNYFDLTQTKNNGTTTLTYTRKAGT
jgi:hypothetical protein